MTSPAHDLVSPPGRATSADGTDIAYRTTGHGPPLVLVHGAAADHTRWRPLLPYLEPYFSVHALDRRGRGDSGDGAAYSIEREYEDVAAVVDAVAVESGTKVGLYGHSHGAHVAIGAATLTDNLDRVILYEGWPTSDPEAYALPGDLAARIDAQIADGDPEGAVELLFRELELMSDDDMAAFKAAPSWAGRVAAIHTLSREIEAEATTRLDADGAARITASVLLVVGEHSPDPSQAAVEDAAAAIPNSRVLVLEGREHVADVLEPEWFAARILPFLRGED